jgi:hypothetical protein
MELLVTGSLVASVSNHMSTSASRATNCHQIRLQRPDGVFQMSSSELLHHLPTAEKQTPILFLPSPPRLARNRSQEPQIRIRRRQAASLHEVLAIGVVSSSDQWSSRREASNPRPQI